MADGQVVFEISGDNKGIKQTLSDTTSAIDSESKKWDKAAGDSAKTMEEKITSAFKAITASAVAMKVGKALVDFGKDAIQAASDLEEVQNVVDVTFGSSAGQIEKWAKSAGQQFGLTETQAKKFTSTLGAMMKSAGLAGPEIVDMSTDLAGLAADMASFYNLDFETAFQKIRSGISGETEPLKQLGINMSVANLEAYALTQGISKAFDEMTQGEQTMLRYQYLMQATADAQGDFARTSDGYANTLRQFETNLESLKTSIGTVIMPVVKDVIEGINNMLGALTQTKPRTVLDEFADIDLKTEEKLADIQATADEANALIAVLEDLGGKQITSTSLTNFVSSLTGKLNGLDSAMSAAANGDYAGTISGIAQAMAEATGGDATAWNTLLTAIGDKLPDAVDATLDDAGQTEAFLAAAAAAADDLGGEYPGLWQQMLQVLGTDAGAAISALANGATAASALQGLANGLNALSPSVSENKWKTLLEALSANGNIDISGTGKSIEDLAAALNGNDPNTDKATAWKDLISVLSSDMESLSALTGKDAEGTKAWLEELAAGADALDPNDVAGWNSLFETLRGGLPGLTGKDDWLDLLGALKDSGNVSFGNVGQSLGDFASALNGNDPNTDRAEAWQALLDALSADAESLTALTGTSAEETAEWLKTLADGANELDPNSADGWSNLFNALVAGLPGLQNTEYADLFADISGGADDSERYLRALGYETDDIKDKQAAWLEVCRRLVQTIPGLNSIINTETGEVDGGTEAIKAYVEAWQQGQEKLAMLQALQAKRAALDEKFKDIPYLRIDAALARKHAQEAADAMREAYGIEFDELGNELNAEELNPANIDIKAWKSDLADYRTKLAAALAAEAELARQLGDLDTAEKALKEEEQIVQEMPGAIDNMTDSIDAATESMTELEKAANGDKEAIKGIKSTIETATKALEEVDKAYKKIYDGIRNGLDKSADGFSEVVTPAEKARREMKDLTKEIQELNSAGKDTSGVTKTFQNIADQVPTVQNMTKSLQSQIAFLEQYQKDYEAARARGVSESILAAMSNGSVESADYLHALATTGTDEEIQHLNEMWQGIITTKEQMSTSMADTVAAADEDFQELVQVAEDAVAKLDQYSAAESAMESTVQGIADGIAAKVSAVQAQVDALNAVLGSIGSIGGVIGGILGGAFKLNGSHAMGLDYVPFNGYLAELHEGESVLTSEEARVWRGFKTGSEATRNNIDYDAMGSLMRENIKPGGNVYMDGRIVGEVVSARQGNSLRNLERSGWQK